MKAGAKIGLVLGSHADVPYGSGSCEFEKVYTCLLKPFVSNLYKYPRIQSALHYSGVLLHWVERSHPELFMLIEDMVARKQVEILGGGFYEPALPVIPLQDKIGQIELQTTYLRKQFGKRPLGCWIPAFAWEQNMVSPLAACGMGFTFLSERQFVLAGAGDPPLYPCICEDQGKLITVFPVLKSLEASLAEKNISAVLEDFYNRRPENEEVLISVFPEKLFADPSESPEFTWGRFFEELSLCDDFVETVGPGRTFKNLKGLKKLVFPDSAGTEVSPRRFITEHPEANEIYSKMIFTNLLINQLRGDKSRKLSAREESWKAQGISLFGMSGERGLHNHTLRNAAYSSLLGAEKITRENGKFIPSLVPYDINMDGEAEWLFQDVKINCYVQSPGGGIFELDYLPKTWNYLGTSGGRFAFADCLLPAGANGEGEDPSGEARLCSRECYELYELDKVHRKLHLVLHRSPSLPFGYVEIEKMFIIKNETVSVGYSLVNRGEQPESFRFTTRMDFALPCEGEAFSRFFACKTGTSDTQITEPLLQNADGLKIQDLRNEVQIMLTASKSFDGRLAPVHVSDDATGVRLYQAICVMPFFPVSLNPGESWDVEFTLKFSN